VCVCNRAFEIVYTRCAYVHNNSCYNNINSLPPTLTQFTTYSNPALQCGYVTMPVAVGGQAAKTTASSWPIFV